MLQIAQKDYGFGKTKNKSLTKAIYDEIGDHFRALWGKEAGWAHSVGYYVFPSLTPVHFTNGRPLGAIHRRLERVQRT